MKIDRANKRNLTEANDLPDLSTSVQMFFQNIKIDVIRKENNSGYVKEKKLCILTQGVRQTFTPAQLAMKPEGERTWKWSKLHTLPEPKLKLDDIVQIRGIKYRVMVMADQSEYGFEEYDLQEDYINED
jgi:hypothetical protein